MVLVMVFPPVWPWAGVLNVWSQFPHMYSKAFELPDICSTLKSEHAVFLCFKSTENFRRPWGFEVRDMGCDLVQGIRLNTNREIYCPLKTWVVAVFAGQWGRKVLQGMNFLHSNHNMDVLKMKSCLEDLCSGEERRSDKYMCMTPNEMWKGKIIKGHVTFPIYNQKGSMGGESNCILGENKWEGTFLVSEYINMCRRAFFFFTRDRTIGTWVEFILDYR